MSYENQTAGEVLLDTLTMLKETREDLRGALVVVEGQIEAIEQSGHLPSDELLARLGYNMALFGKGGEA